MSARTACLAILSAVALASAAADEPAGRVVHVAGDNQLRAALAQAKPGDTLRLAAGDYKSVYARGLAGTADRPIVIESADPMKLAVFVGGGCGLHLSDVSHLVLRHLAVRGQTDNGINIDDGGTYETPSHHVRLEKLRIQDVGPKGNHDGIKLSGLDDFQVIDCEIEGWGGSAIDMVGCHDGLIAGCTFRGKAGFSQETGPQAKGGSRNIVIRACRFENAAQRGVNIGGSTGRAFFRPAVPAANAYEAQAVTVEGCTFIGSLAPVAFVGCDGAIVRYNTIYRPGKWAARILQETADEPFVPCRNGVFERNVIVFHRGELSPAVNVGPKTAPQTFVFRENVWFCADAPADSRPSLPTRETGGVYGQDPKLKDPAKGDLTVTAAGIDKFAGANAWPPTTQPQADPSPPQRPR